jgi:hypothetical protein
VRIQRIKFSRLAEIVVYLFCSVMPLESVMVITSGSEAALIGILLFCSVMPIMSVVA